MSRLSALWVNHKGSIIVGVITAVAATAVLGFFSGIAYLVKSIYDAPFEARELKQDLVRAVEKSEFALSKKLDDQTRQLTEQAQQLESGRKDIQSIKQAILTLVLISNVSQEEKEKLIRQLSAAIEGSVVAATADFARGRYEAAYSKLFELSAKGSADARSALFSTSDVLYERVRTQEATPRERKAFTEAIGNATKFGIVELVDRYEARKPRIMPFKDPKPPSSKGD
jgi:hypothetical protein